MKNTTCKYNSKYTKLGITSLDETFVLDGKNILENIVDSKYMKDRNAFLMVSDGDLNLAEQGKLVDIKNDKLFIIKFYDTFSDYPKIIGMIPRDTEIDENKKYLVEVIMDSGCNGSWKIDFEFKSGFNIKTSSITNFLMSSYGIIDDYYEFSSGYDPNHNYQELEFKLRKVRLTEITNIEAALVDINKSMIENKELLGLSESQCLAISGNLTKDFSEWW